MTVDWRMHSRKPRDPREPPFVSVSSSMSVNSQGLVLFSMLHDGQELARFAPNSLSGLADLSCAAAAMPEAAAPAPPFYSRVISIDSSRNGSIDYGSGSSQHSPRDDATAEV